MSTLTGILLIALVIWLWLDGARAREIATGICEAACRQRGLQFLDQTVALRHLGVRRTAAGLRLRRVYRFDFSEEGVGRRSGYLVLQLAVLLERLGENDADGDGFVTNAAGCDGGDYNHGANDDNSGTDATCGDAGNSDSSGMPNHNDDAFDLLAVDEVLTELTRRYLTSVKIPAGELLGFAIPVHGDGHLRSGAPAHAAHRLVDIGDIDAVAVDRDDLVAAANS